jgi:hypothetical protein
LGQSIKGKNDHFYVISDFTKGRKSSYRKGRPSLSHTLHTHNM